MRSSHAQVSNSMRKSIVLERRPFLIIIKPASSSRCQTLWHQPVSWHSRLRTPSIQAIGVTWVAWTWFGTAARMSRAICMRIAIRSSTFTCRMRLWRRGGVPCMKPMPARVAYASKYHNYSLQSTLWLCFFLFCNFRFIWMLKWYEYIQNVHLPCFSLFFKPFFKVCSSLTQNLDGF